MKKSGSVRVGLVVSVALALGTGGCSRPADNNVAELTPAGPASTSGATQQHRGWGFFPWFVGGTGGTGASGITPDKASGANSGTVKRGGFGGGGSSFTG